MGSTASEADRWLSEGPTETVKVPLRKRFSTSVKISKLDESKRLAFGWASVAVGPDGEIIIDHDRDIIPPAELEKAAFGFVLGSDRKAGEMHRENSAGKVKPIGRLVESVFCDAEKRKAMGLEGGDGVAWWTGFRIEDPEVWTKVRSGHYSELSIGGSAKRVPLDESTGIHKLIDLEIDEVSVVDAGAGLGVKLTLAKQRNAMTQIRKLGLEDLKEKLTPDEYALILSAIEAAADSESPEEALEAAESEMTEEEKAEDEDEKEDEAKAEDEEEEEKAEDKEEEEEEKAAKLRKMVASERLARQGLEKRLADVEKARRIEKTMTRVEKAYAGIPESNRNLVGVLMAIEDIQAAKGGKVSIDPRVAKTLQNILDRSAAAIASGDLMRSFGSSAEASDDSPDAELQGLAKKLNTADMTEAQAYVKACHERPDLYAQVGE